MGLPRILLKRNAKAALSAHYWAVIGILLLGGILASLVSTISSVPGYVSKITAIMSGYSDEYAMLATGASAFSTIFSILGIIVALIFEVGIVYFCYTVYRGDEPKIENLFIMFTDGRFLRVLGGMLLVFLYTFLWSLLFLVPGIIKGYQYSMMPYLLVDRPELTIKECFALSKQMTDGYKYDIFCVELSFIGWEMLSLLTIGILSLFFVGPYKRLAIAGIYDYLKRKNMPQIETTTETTGYQSGDYEADYTNASTNDNYFDE